MPTAIYGTTYGVPGAKTIGVAPWQPISPSTPGGVITPEPSQPTVSVTTGLDPDEYARATYGKPIAIWAASKPRIGATIIWGPEIRIEDNVVRCDFGVSFGIPADPTGSRELLELRFDGNQVWTSTDGDLTGGDLVEDTNFRFYPGSETQEPDALEVAKYPDAPIAYRGQCLIFFEDIPLTDYENRIPHVAAKIADSTFGDPDDRVLAGEALEAIAGNPHLGMDSDEFATEDITLQCDGIILAENVSFIEWLERFSRMFPWDVVQREKLMVIERGADEPDLTVTTDNIVNSDEGSIVVQRTQEADVSRELEFKYIDIDRDYEINPQRARRPRDPVPVTASIGKETINLPVVMTAGDAASWVTLRKYQDELSRDKVALTLMPYGIMTEPGDFLRLNAPFKTYLLRVLETLKGANWTTEVVAEQILRCTIPGVQPEIDAIITTASAAYSTRKVRSAYAGFAIQVRRSTDSAITDIGFTSGGDLDVSALLAFSQGGDCFVRTWYDQSGNGRNATQAVSGAQPQIVTGGLLTSQINSHSAVRFSGQAGGKILQTASGTFVSASAYTAFSVARAVTGGSFAVPRSNKCLFGTSSNNWGMSFASTTYAAAPCMTSWRLDNAAGVRAADKAYTFDTDASFMSRFSTADASPFKSYVNGGTPGTDAGTNNNNATSDALQIGVTNSSVGQCFDGPIGELFIFNTQLSLLNSNLIGLNCAQYWGLTWTDITA